MAHRLLTCFAAAFAVLMLALMPVTAQAQSYPDSPDEKDLVDVAVEGDFGTLVTALEAAGLVETLKSDGPFTVFAPTEEAFAALPEGTLEELLQPENRDQLTAILTYHVVPGEVTSSEVVELSSAETVQGGELNISTEGQTVMINDASVVETDIQASNGVIHVIDSVLMPPMD